MILLPLTPDEAAAALYSLQLTCRTIGTTGAWRAHLVRVAQRLAGHLDAARAAESMETSDRNMSDFGSK